jgi:probable DNA repair protein
MYDWLTDALRGSSTVITANRRLARILQAEFAEQQLREGKLAWESPAIYSWQGWLEQMFQGSTDPSELPTRINQHQSQLLWERSLAREMPESYSRLAALVRLSRETWRRLADWRVSIGEVARSAENGDQRLFANAAGRYLGILERQHWVDDAGLALCVEQLITAGRARCQGRVTLVGFDRERPIVVSIMAALASSGCDVRSALVPELADFIGLQPFATADAEMRAAGAWAREKIHSNPKATVAIIAANLEQEAEHKAHLVREGFMPGWQYGPLSIGRYVNVSYGRRLVDYPAVSIALLLLRWLVRDLSAGDFGHLLRTPLIGPTATGARSRMELRLRRLPDRLWSPSMVSSALPDSGEDSDAAAWLGMVARISKQRRELKKTASPAEWAVYIDETLAACQWPGMAALSSADFQLRNRWRELLNDLARLDLVSPAMGLPTAIRRLELMAAETVFQAETETQAVQLIGPLEASGAEFDAIWISGLTAANWPPSGNPSPLVSRRLQKRLAMPDAEPADTVAYAQKLLARLASAGKEVLCSYALTEDDAEQTSTALLQPLAPVAQTGLLDPGWHASKLTDVADTVVVPDRVPKIRAEEHVSGGAGTIQRQLADPIAAFIVGRLGVRSLQPQAVGLPATLRGNIVHDALCHLYSGRPDCDAIRAWTDDERYARITESINSAISRHERNTDAVLRELFQLERRRVAELLECFLSVDLEHGEFSIAEVEHDVAFSEAGVHLQLRVDRIDRLRDGTLAILDYKTGAKKKFLRGDGQPQEIQLIAYASALNECVSAVALVNVDTREVSFDGAGRGYTVDESWDDTLAGWQRIVTAACKDLSRGDVRINRAQGVQEARYFNLLSRYTERRRDA